MFDFEALEEPAQNEHDSPSRLFFYTDEFFKANAKLVPATAAFVPGPESPGWRPTDTPDWDAPAPGGWWRVVNEHGCWQNPVECESISVLEWHRCGEILAAEHVFDAKDEEGIMNVFISPRDTCGVKTMMLCSGRVPKPNGEILDYGVVMELLPTGALPPTLEDRLIHVRVVEQRLRSFLNVAAMKSYVRTMTGCVMDNTKFPTAFTLGYPTAPYSSGQAKALLLEAMDDESPSAFQERFLRDGYFVIDNALRGKTEDLARDVKTLDETGALQADIATTSQGIKMKRRTMWIDEEMVRLRYNAPVFLEALALMRGLADELNPIVSRHHAARKAADDPEHSQEAIWPASANAVLTVAPDVMLASYAGDGTVFPAHVDNVYNKTFGRRQNARELTAILYANSSSWNRERDGGELVIYPGSTEHDWDEEKAVTIAPKGGRLVVFFSSLRHEVLPIYKRRRQMTLWIFRPDVPHQEEFKVVGEYIVKRGLPSSSAEVCGSGKLGDTFKGNIVKSEGTEWLKIEEMWFKIGKEVPKYIMLHHPDHGQLLQKL